MTRVLTIVGVVCFLMAAGVAGASSSSQVRLPVSVSSEPPPSLGPGRVVVERGDHLWKISARHLGPDATDDEIAPYWRVIVDVNTPHLRSGDPDLIYPGEMVELPTTRARR